MVFSVWGRTVGAIGPAYPPDPVPSSFPDASNTGVPTGTVLTAYTGPSVITVPGTLIENKIIEDTLEIGAISGVTIRNCRVQNSGIHGIFGDAATNVTIEHCDLVGSAGANVSTGILTSGTFTANDISGYSIGINPTGPATIKDNYIHDLARAGVDPHFDGIALFGNQNGVLIEHNTIIVPVSGGTADVLITDQPFGPVNNVTLRSNLMRGAPSYTCYSTANAIGSVTNILIENNVMEKGAFGYINIVNTAPIIRGNTDFVTGQLIPDNNA